MDYTVLSCTYITTYHFSQPLVLVVEVKSVKLKIPGKKVSTQFAKKMLSHLLLLICATTSLRHVASTQVNSTFYLTGLFPVDSKEDNTRLDLGIYTRAAAQMAVEDINQMQLLSALGFRMELVPFESGCEDANSVNGLLEVISFLKEVNEFEGRFINSIPTFHHAILGPACNSPAVLTASLTSVYLNTVQMSYAADTPQLANVNHHPLFFQSVPSYSAYQDTIYSVMREFDWLNVGVIHEGVQYYTVALEQFAQQLQQNIMNSRLVVTQGLDSHLALAETEGARIFIGMVPAEDAAAMLCAAHRLGTTGPGYQWILLGNFEENWWRDFGDGVSSKFRKRRCREKEMLQAVESVLILTHDLQMRSQETVTISGKTVKEFWVEFRRHFNTSKEIEFQEDRAYRVPSTYDAVWSIALALNETLSLFTDSNVSTNATSNFTTSSDLSQENLFAFALKQSLENLNFTGVSGKVRFTHQSHSQLPPTTVISQMQSGVMLPIGIHNPDTGVLNLSYFGSVLSWKGRGPPRDRPRIQLQNVSIWLVSAILGLTIVGLLFALAMFIVNLYYRKHKVIKASSPYINMIIIAGCVFGFCSIIVMSIESIDIHQYITPSAYPFLCNIRPWLLSCGFTLSFGALFAKTWRIYVIFRNPWKTKRPYKDHVLIAMVGAFLIFDIVLLVLWATLDPLMLSHVVVDVDEESFTQEEHIVCTPSNGVGIRFVIWIGVISIPKAILLLFGTFLVTQAGKIKTKFFNDAKYIAIAMYGVVIFSLGGMPTTIISMYKFEEDLGYADATSTILICCYLILTMVFIPKLVLLKRYKHKVPTAVLLNINPSFRIKNYHRATQHTMPKRNMKLNENNMSANTSTSTLTSSRVQLCEETVIEDTMNSRRLEEGWETAEVHSLDDHHHGQQVIEVDGEEIVKFGDISYIACVSYTLEDRNGTPQQGGGMVVES